jgi:hypothetical protein
VVSKARRWLKSDQTIWSKLTLGEMKKRGNKPEGKGIC